MLASGGQLAFLHVSVEDTFSPKYLPKKTRSLSGLHQSPLADQALLTALHVGHPHPGHCVAEDHRPVENLRM